MFEQAGLQDCFLLFSDTVNRVVDDVDLNYRGLHISDPLTTKDLENLIDTFRRKKVSSVVGKPSFTDSLKLSVQVSRDTRLSHIVIRPVKRELC